MEQVLLENLTAGVLTLTLNRPERLNALTIPLMRQLAASVAAAESNPDVRVVVLTGAGRGFCAGGDVRDGRRDDTAGDRPKTDPGWSRAEQRYDRVRSCAQASVILNRMSKPTIASLRGAVIGAGFSLAAACDFRIASETVLFRTAFAAIGYSGDYGGSCFLPRIVGHARALELYLLNEKLDAAAADKLGLLTRLVADDQLESETLALATRLAEGPPVAFRYIKQNLNASHGLSPEELVDLETTHMMRTTETEDAKEAAKAMVEKRPAVFRGY